MKTFTFTASLLLVCMVTFAQSPVCPTFFRRNNGNGACPDGQLKLYFTSCPSTALLIDSVYTNGAKANVTFGLPNSSQCNSQEYISYCVSGGNMPPAETWTIFFHNSGSISSAGCIVTQVNTLPIGIKTFTAKRTGSGVSLNWQTSFESNAQAIGIQRKSGNDWITIGSVAATNNTNGSSYSFIDYNSTSGISEYRLRLLSKDAEAQYSEIRSVKGSGASPDFILFPNPASKNAKISITDINDQTEIQVMDNTGRVVKTIATKNSHTIELNNLQTGIYRIRMMNRSTGEFITKSLTVLQ